MLNMANRIMREASRIPVKKARAKNLMKRHQNGEGEFYQFNGISILCWPASNQIGEGNGYWHSVVSGGYAMCGCPSYGKDSHCKHLILLARLILYHHQEDIFINELSNMNICSG